ncbi:diacylglycerol kinase family protein [Azospirillum sp. SYSU D00513]|uniref:diacylglycerol/lipid kinase family protein n=1 Tax=Azospirillum sp. SYSU D00513 TaxID=2812561 RepID=UPI001A95FF55|nr:diacylglycerol kinase family protein [Azospirillum sp. SYSU D00513]
MKMAIVLNQSAGSLVGRPIDDTVALIRSAFEKRGTEVSITTVEGAACDDALRKAIESDADTIVIGGGDGTVHGAVNRILPTGKTLGIIPLGTLNLLARDLGTPLDLEGAIEALADGEKRAIDVAEVNGKVYLNSSVLGFYPAVVQERERQRKQHRLLKWPGMVVALAKSLHRLPILDVEIDWGQGPRRIRTPILAVSNNIYDEGFGLVLRRERLDSGKLGVHVARNRDARSILRLMARLVMGTWKRDDELETLTATRLTVRTFRGRLKMVNDGEVLQMKAPLHYSIRPGALNILAPRREPAQDTARNGAAEGVAGSDAA